MGNRVCCCCFRWQNEYLPINDLDEEMHDDTGRASLSLKTLSIPSLPLNQKPADRHAIGDDQFRRASMDPQVAAKIKTIRGQWQQRAGAIRAVTSSTT